MASFPLPLLVLGGGNMGRAIVEGAVAAGVLAPDRTVVVDPDAATHGVFTGLGVACDESVRAGQKRLESLESEHGPGAMLLAVKPQMLGMVADSLGGAVHAAPRLVLSILAGMTTDRLAAVVGGRVVRLMPNTPAQIGRGITAMCPAGGTRTPEAAPTPDDLAATRMLFEAVGRVIDLPENLLDAFTAVAGSGPAYLFHLAEGMVAGAEAVGFSRAQALELVCATIAGAAGLLERDPETDPAHLREMVTSKGGTTAAALGVLDEREVLNAVRDAIVAARDRGRELAR